MHNISILLTSIASKCPGGKLPDDYLVMDIETSGFNYNPPEGEKPDVIVQVGYAAVRDRKIVSNSAHYIRRPRGTMKGEALEVTGITDDILQQQGEPANELYPRLIQLINLYRKSGCMFVGHNIIAFDGPFISRELSRMGFDFNFRDGEFIDTGCIFKAVQMQTQMGSDETLASFSNRIIRTRSYVKWRLEFAIKTYEIDKRYNIDVNRAHDAGVDCLMTHYLLETFREQVAG